MTMQPTQYGHPISRKKVWAIIIAAGAAYAALKVGIGFQDASVAFDHYFTSAYWSGGTLWIHYEMTKDASGETR